MKNTPKGHSAESLKRKAKEVKKSRGISHVQALDIVAKENGAENWKHYLKDQPLIAKIQPTIRRPETPVPSTLKYFNVVTGHSIGEHPNRKMPIRRHKAIGKILHQLSLEIEYHKRARNHVQDIRSILDDWMGCEYSESELGNEKFNNIYYGRKARILKVVPSLGRTAELKRMLRRIGNIVERSYHSCKPVEKLQTKIGKALESLDKWPKTARGFNSWGKNFFAGKFVRVKGTKQIGLVIYHDVIHKTVELYGDGGYFVAGSEEVSTLKKQPSISDFRPMRLHLPYGKWKCEDGVEVLFNRDYCPLWKREKDGKISQPQPDSRVGYLSSEFYFDDATAPYYSNPVTAIACLNVLNEWGILDKSNLLLDRLPQAVEERDVSILSPGAFS